MPITLPDETKTRFLASLKRFSVEHWDQELDDLGAMLFLDFLMKEFAPLVHNAAIAETQAFMRDRLADLEATCSEPEFAFWPKGTSVRRKRD